MVLCDKTGHLISDTSWDELHNFAAKMGLKREWFQEAGRLSHYDLTTSRAKKTAVNMGAKLVSSKQIVNTLNTLYMSDKK